MYDIVLNKHLEAMKELIRQGNKYPGANYVIRPDGKRKKITEDLKEEALILKEENQEAPAEMIEGAQEADFIQEDSKLF